jgi:hypothetical protein
MKTIFEVNDVVLHLPDSFVGMINACDYAENKYNIIGKDGEIVEGVKAEDIVLCASGAMLDKIVNDACKFDQLLYWGNGLCGATLSELEEKGYKATADEFTVLSKKAWNTCMSAGIKIGKGFFVRFPEEKGEDPINGPYVLDEKGDYTNPISGKGGDITDLVRAINRGVVILDAAEELKKIGFVPENSQAQVQANVVNTDKKRKVSHHSSQPSAARGKATEIFADYSSKQYSVKQLADKYNASMSTIFRILRQERNNLRKRMQSAIDAA